ncbi:hypothetical protein BGW80DRAFT_1447241 [Lactifluus volemus]|nr:hypothetical protein BGW80DRAFT_1447241 [Lactifluus volemus]
MTWYYHNCAHRCGSRCSTGFLVHLLGFDFRFTSVKNVLTRGFRGQPVHLLRLLDAQARAWGRIRVIPGGVSLIVKRWTMVKLRRLERRLQQKPLVGLGIVLHVTANEFQTVEKIAMRLSLAQPQQSGARRRQEIRKGNARNVPHKHLVSFLIFTMISLVWHSACVGYY